MMDVFFSIAHEFEKGLKFHAQLQTGAILDPGCASLSSNLNYKLEMTCEYLGLVKGDNKLTY